jgi:hypothetical protein
MPLPEDSILTSDLTPTRAYRRLKSGSTWEVAAALASVIAAAKPQLVSIGVRSAPGQLPRLTVLVRTGADVYLSDNSTLNFERTDRWLEVRSVAEAALNTGAQLLSAIQLLPWTDGLRPEEAIALLEKQPVAPATTADELLGKLRAVLGR